MFSVALIFTDMTEQEISDKIDLKRKELSMSDEPKEQVRIQLRIKILQHQLEISRLQKRL